MFRQMVGAVAAAVPFAAVVLAQAPVPSADPLLSPLWSVTTGVAAPESAYHDPASNAVFVSSINGQILEKDGNGYISRLTPDGTMVAARWVTGLNAPKGLRSVGGTLWVTDIDEVVSIDIASARITARIPVPGARFLNDLATAADGTVFASDSNLSRIYMMKNGTASIFVEGAATVEQPNGLLVDRGRLILGTIGPAPSAASTAGPSAGGARPGGHLFAFDLVSRRRTQLTTQPVGGIDGIEPDGRGGLLVTDVLGSRLLHVSAGGDVRVLGRFSAAGADFGYIPATRTAIVPFLFGNSVSGFDLTAALR